MLTQATILSYTTKFEKSIRAWFNFKRENYPDIYDVTHFHAKCHYDRGPYYLIIAINFWSIRQIFNYYYIFITIGPSFCSNRRVWLECAIWIGHHPRSFFQTLTFYAARNHERIIVNKAMKFFSFPGKRNSESLRVVTDKFLFCFFSADNLFLRSEIPLHWNVFLFLK